MNGDSLLLTPDGDSLLLTPDVSRAGFYPNGTYVKSITNEVTCELKRVLGVRLASSLGR